MNYQGVEDDVDAVNGLLRLEFVGGTCLVLHHQMRRAEFRRKTSSLTDWRGDKTHANKNQDENHLGPETIWLVGSLAVWAGSKVLLTTLWGGMCSTTRTLSACCGSKPCERKLLVAKFRGRYLVFLLLAQESSFGIVLRSCTCDDADTVLALLPRTQTQCFVDDPLTALRGSRDHRDKVFVLFVTVWRSLGFPVSCWQWSRRTNVVWISVSFWPADMKPKSP